MNHYLVMLKVKLLVRCLIFQNLDLALVLLAVRWDVQGDSIRILKQCRLEHNFIFG